MTNLELTGSTIIRAAVQEDVATCLQLDMGYETDYVWQIDIRDEAGAIVTSFRTARLPRMMRGEYPQTEDGLTSALDRQDTYLIAETSRGIAGYIIMRLDFGRSLAWISDLAVGRAFRRARLGTGLLASAYERARARGMRRLMIELQSKNYPGICFCQKNGLVFCGFHDRYYPNHDIALFFGQNIRP